MTDDPDVYADAWLNLGKKVEPYFPGYVASSFNPDIEFVCHSPKPYSSRFTLTVEQINLLVKSAVPR